MASPRDGGDRLLALDEGEVPRWGRGSHAAPTLRQWRTRGRSSLGSELTIASLTGTPETYEEPEDTVSQRGAVQANFYPNTNR